MVQIIEPQDGMSIYDPTVGSGGMLIQSKRYVQETGGDSRTSTRRPGTQRRHLGHLQDEHDPARHPPLDIRQGDTLKAPQHLDEDGEVRRFNRVIANPPFSQTTPQGMEFKERFHHFMPERARRPT